MDRIKIEYPTYTILITNHNYDRFIKPLLEIINIGFPQPDVLLVCDETSELDLDLLSSRFHNLQLSVITREKTTQFDKIKEGLKCVDTDIVFLLDADDSMTPMHVISALDIFKIDINADMVISSYSLIGNTEDKKLVKRSKPIFDDGKTRQERA